MTSLRYDAASKKKKGSDSLQPRTCNSPEAPLVPTNAECFTWLGFTMHAWNLFGFPMWVRVFFLRIGQFAAQLRAPGGFRGFSLEIG